MEKLEQILSQEDVAILLKHFIGMLLQKHPQPWIVESDRGYYIEDTNKQHVTGQGIDDELAHRFIKNIESGGSGIEGFNDTENRKWFERLFNDITIRHRLGWNIKSEQGNHWVDAKGLVVIAPGLQKELLEKVIALAWECAKEADAFAEEFEKGNDLELGILGRELPVE